MNFFNTSERLNLMLAGSPNILINLNSLMGVNYLHPSKPQPNQLYSVSNSPDSKSTITS